MFSSFGQFKRKVVTILNFTALLIEHSYARHIYNSTEVSIVVGSTSTVLLCQVYVYNLSNIVFLYCTE